MAVSMVYINHLNQTLVHTYIGIFNQVNSRYFNYYVMCTYVQLGR